MPGDANLYFGSSQQMGSGRPSGATTQPGASTQSRSATQPRATTQPRAPTQPRVPLGTLSVPQAVNRNQPNQLATSGNGYLPQPSNPALIENSTMRAADRFTGPLPLHVRGDITGSRNAGQAFHFEGSQEQNTSQISSLPPFRPTSDKVALLRRKKPVGGVGCPVTSREIFRLDTAKQITVKGSRAAVDWEPMSKMAMVIGEIEASVFDHLGFRFFGNEGKATAIMIPSKDSSGFGTLNANLIQEGIFECTTLTSVLAQGKERPLLVTIEAILVSNKLAWFERTDEKAIAGQETVKGNVMRQRGSWGLDPSAVLSIVIVLGGGQLFFVIVIDH